MKRNSLLNRLNEENIRIDEVFHLDLITNCESAPVSFIDFMEDPDLLGKFLEIAGLSFGTIHELNSITYPADLLHLLLDNNINGVLVRYSTPYPTDIEVVNDTRRFSYSWECTMNGIAYGHNLNAALTMLIEDKRKRFDYLFE